MHGEGGGVFGEECRKPGAKFVRIRPAETGFDGHWQTGRINCVAVTFDGEFGGFDHGGSTTGFIDMLVGAAKI